MLNRSENYLREVILGQRLGLWPGLLRGGLAIAEPFYALAVGMRNWMYDARLFGSHHAGRPVVCVGNLTTGGTGKTPVVSWLTEHLRRAGHRPAILMRGYKSTREHGSDEHKLLEKLLADESLPEVRIIANPDRVEGAARALRLDPKIELFILDDGFQHRRLRRDFDLVLIDATNPFGGGHLLPRGLLRESLRGLRRACAILITHSEGAAPEQIDQITQTIRRHNPFAPIYRASHTPQLDFDVAGTKLVAFCGIGNPQSFEGQFGQAGAQVVARQRFSDHHAYAASDLARLDDLARRSGAEAMVTTEKDWIKLQRLIQSGAPSLPIYVVRLEIQFDGDDGVRLLEQISASLRLPEPASQADAG